MPRRSLLGARLLALALPVALLGAPGPAAGETPLAPLAPGTEQRSLGREVFGYLPYWEIDGGIEAYLRYELLTTIAFFSIQFRSSGAIDTSLPGYARYVGETAARITERAHAAGVRTVLTIQSFGSAKNAALFGDPAAQATAIEATVALMTRRGADGVNVDVELLDEADLDAYGRFVANLRAAALAANPNAQVSVATGAGASGARMARTALANGADRVFVMAYDYRWAGSPASGAIAPLTRPGGASSITRTLEIYADWYGLPLDRVLLGLPFYGRTWPTTSDALNAPVQPNRFAYGGSSAFYPKKLPAAAEGATRLVDDPELSVRLVRYDAARGTWFQTYYDDPTTLAPKVALTNERGMAGVGIWALGYDRDQPGYWDVIAGAYGAPRIVSLTASDATVPPLEPSALGGATPAPPPGVARSASVLVAATWADGPLPATAIRLSNDGKRWSAWLPLASTIPWMLAPGADGRRTIHAQLAGGPGGPSGTGPTSAVARTTIVLDTTPPVVAAPIAAPLAGSSFTADGTTLRIAWGATDGSTAIASTALEARVGDEPYGAVALPTGTSREARVEALSGRTYRFRAAAIDTAGNVAVHVESAPLRVVPVDERTPALRLSAGWARGGSAGSHAGTVTSTTTPKAEATYAFSGSAIAIVGPVGPGRGAARVYLDGATVGAFSAYASANASRRILFSRAVAPGRHTLRIVASGTAGRPRLDLDAFLVVR